ncbi:putative P-loop containing nucleoside triphosphate hydrolase, leucine-rich repeat domain superfamily [Helianthus annuus]|nr:putative P-loop containing nucleoside triphosphate hydrolase, leucine-rich repeat domain superfamily [Helianthus annuus]
MTYTGLELFIESLKQMSYSNNNPIINNNTSILSGRFQMQLLYQELGYMYQILFSEEQNVLNEIEEMRNLKRKFKDVAHEAHMIVGLFVYSTNYSSARKTETYSFIKYFQKCMKIKRSTKYQHSLNLDDVLASLNSIKKELITILNNWKKSSGSIDSLKTQTQTVVAGTSGTRNPLGTKKVLEESIVGLIRDAELIRDMLAKDQKQLDVISIVGMGGLGKTTLATKVYNDPFIVYHFHIRAWVTVSQTYERRDLLLQLVTAICTQFDPDNTSDTKLREKLHKTLMDRRYFIVVDDVWSIQAWDDIKVFFPNDNNGSRILLTSRLKEVALHPKSNGFVHELELLTDVESWELLCKKVFHGNDPPIELIESGKEIARKCHGLPLVVVVIAGVLAKEVRSKYLWDKIAEHVGAYIFSDHGGNTDILALSYDHLPPHLKDCFLYLGGFPEDHKFQVRKLIWLWMAEGFVVEDGKRSLEEIGEDYLMELVDRNLVVVTDRKFNGAIKACSVHDLLRELCLKRATKGHFWLKVNDPVISFTRMRKYKPRRIFTNRSYEFNIALPQSFPWVHSLLWFHKNKSLSNITNEYLHPYPLLMVLDIQKCEVQDFPQTIGLLVHLRYLAFCSTKGFPSSICNLWSLQTIIVKSSVRFRLPYTISNLVNLRHLWSNGYMYFPSTRKPMNLQTISNVALCYVAESWDKCFPRVKKLTCTTHTHHYQDFKSLSSLETLMWINTTFRKVRVSFPDSLKKLSLSGCCLPWSDVSIVQSLPNLEVLNILEQAFMGPIWETTDVPFQQLKFLKLHGLNIEQWEASSINFPCLTHLVLDTCRYLQGIPLEIGDISTLELIDVDDSSKGVVESLDIIQEEQENFGNYNLKINVRKELRRLTLSRKLNGLAWMVDW